MNKPITLSVDTEKIIKDYLVIVSGVTNGKEWELVGFDKTKAFDKFMLKVAKELGCREIACGSTTK